MAYAFNTFDAGLQAKGLGSYLDGDGELKDGTSQAFFSAQYAAWLNDLIAYHANAIRTRYALAVGSQSHPPSEIPTTNSVTVGFQTSLRLRSCA
jgi:hypothetical protein